ncbi:MAG: energy-coupling factor ABC transporter permease [Pseudomonadota bacterium]
MHIPDGFLTTPVWATLDAISLPAVAFFARRAQRDLEDTKIPLLGVMGAFVFAAQMINFPVGIGTSGHLVGGALLAYTLGPSAATIVLTAILAIQAFVFQDGGIVVLGANVFNMAIAGVLAAWLPFGVWGRTRGRKYCVFLGATLSVLVSAFLALSELLLSGVKMPVAVLWLSIALFAVSALLEGAITVAVLQAIERLNPGWIRRPEGSFGRLGLAAIAVFALLLGSVGVMFASAAPDGIWSLAGQTGIISHARSLLHTPLSGYQWGAFSSAWLRKATAGLAGLVCIYAVCLLLGKMLARQRSA